MSTQQRKSTSITIPVTLRNEIEHLALNIAPKVGHRLSLAEITRAAFKVARAHQTELVRELTHPKEGEAS